MGRQTTIALSVNDERDFLAFLRRDADVRVLLRPLLVRSCFSFRSSSRVQPGTTRFAFEIGPSLGAPSLNSSGRMHLLSEPHISTRRTLPVRRWSIPAKPLTILRRWFTAGFIGTLTSRYITGRRTTSRHSVDGTAESCAGSGRMERELK